MACGLQDFLLFPLHSSQHSAAHTDKTVTPCTKVYSPYQILSNTSHSSVGWLSRACSTTFQAILLKKEVCEQVKALLAWFSIKFFLTYKPSEAFVVIYNTVRRWTAAQFSEYVTSFNWKKKNEPPLIGDPSSLPSVLHLLLHALLCQYRNQVPSNFRHSLHHARLLPGLRSHSLGWCPAQLSSTKQGMFTEDMGFGQMPLLL